LFAHRRPIKSLNLDEVSITLILDLSKLGYVC